ncbi:MAG: rRNA pseudouridine synthase [Clostridia bacterium]|nr:rRNA pseudouridine synthase [Clostridia bacterium]
MEEIRLQKYFTDCKVMSRRAAEKEISDGRVTVNGRVAAVGDKIVPGVDTVEWNGTAILPGESANLYIMLNKPMGYVTTLSDEQGRKSVRELVADVGERVYPVGRLDMYSEGLLLLTSDGELTNRLTHPRHEIPKIYRVKLVGEIDDGVVRKLSLPMEIDGYRLRPVGVSLLGRENGYTSVRMTLYEGRNRQIRKMCEKLGLSVARLTRVAIGDLKLGDLPKGKWRYLTEEEVRYLYERSIPHADR